MNNLLASLKRASEEGLQKFLAYAKEAFEQAAEYDDETQQDFWAAVVQCIEIEQNRRLVP